MGKILGLDLGTNSIGWAIRDTSVKENQIIDKGVLTFEKGVGEGKSGEFPMVRKRTESRHKRRNYQAEKYRKWTLLECLIENRMCPLSIDELKIWKNYTKGVGRKYPQSEKFIEWLRFDFNGDGKPDFEQIGFDKHESYYLYRVLAISENEEHKNIFSRNPEILGRIFYQLVQRRGFKGRDEEEAKTMLKGSVDLGIEGRDTIAPFIEKYKTLGAALYQLQKEKNVRIRKRYNLRTDFEIELKEICRVQNVPEAIYQKLWKAVIWQRPLRNQKGLVGICTFEKNKSRCPISHPLYEEFRTWVFINNLKIELPDNIDKIQYLNEKIYPLFYNASTDFKLSSIIKQLKKDGGQIAANFRDDTKVITCKLLNSFEKLFGKNWKNNLGWNESFNNQGKNCTYSFEDIWHVLLTFDSNEKLKDFGIQKLSLDSELADKFAKIKLPQGYATLSLSAIKKLLPYLYKGIIYSETVYLANLPKVFGEKEINQNLINNFSDMFAQIKNEHDNEKTLNAAINELIRNELNSEYRYRIEDSRELDNSENKLIEQKLNDVFGPVTWNEKPEEERRVPRKYVSKYFIEFLRKPIQGKKEDLFMSVPNLHERIFSKIQETYGIDESRKKFLWHPSEQEIYANPKEITLEDGRLMKFLEDPQPISRGFKNPMALKTLHKLKNIVNYLLKTGKIDENTRVVIEIARELNDANKRKAIEKWQREREKENDDFKKVIDEINKDCKTTYNRDDKTLIDKIRLWKEQNMRCIYTGKTINMCDVFVGNKFDIEHTIPASMSFDNELKNLTIADSTYNRVIKEKRIPFDCPNYNKEVTTNGIVYPLIVSSMELMFGKKKVEEKTIKGKKVEVISYEKIEHLEALYDEWKKKTSDTKEIKDAIIQRRHLIKMELDYWRKKLETFKSKEYKAGWRNSQLRDTQVITKYALPYFKTVFKKAEVQKGSVTATFREIYRIQPKDEKKDRNSHAHHAIDAAVLTLIPTAVNRDKLLLAYNEEKDNRTGKVFHDNPKEWPNFSASHVLAITNDVLINFQPQHRTLTPTYKNVRKRGKQQFVKFKDANGKWYFKFNKEGKKIPLVAKGDSLRGQLHGESFYGAIKQAQRDNNGKIIFDDNNKMKLDENILLVVRKPLQYRKSANVPGFSTLEEIEKAIIDKPLFEIIKKQVGNRPFSEALNEGIWMTDKKGNKVNQIKNIRCKKAAGRGYLTPEKAIEIQKHNFNSKHDYKQHVYAQNEENTLCLYYENETENNIERAFRIVGLFELSKLKLKNIEEIKKENYYKTIDIGRGQNKKQILISEIIQVGKKVIFYRDNIEELRDLSKVNLLKRLFKVYKFNEPAPSTVYIYLQNHIESRTNEELGNGEKDVDLEKYQPRIFLNATKFTCAIDGKHFEIKPDGEIIWKY